MFGILKRYIHIIQVSMHLGLIQLVRNCTRTHVHNGKQPHNNSYGWLYRSSNNNNQYNRCEYYNANGNFISMLAFNRYRACNDNRYRANEDLNVKSYRWCCYFCWAHCLLLWSPSHTCSSTKLFSVKIWQCLMLWWRKRQNYPFDGTLCEFSNIKCTV